jgi:4,5-dihydroxyphthalate decarboxylase
VAFAGLAGIGSGDDLELVEFFEDADKRDADFYRRTGIYPIHGVIAVRNDVLAADSSLARRIFEAFTRARDQYWARVQSGASQTSEDLRYLKQAKVVGDPLPYGLQENYRSLAALVRFAKDQHLLARAPAVEDAFPDPRGA